MSLLNTGQFSVISQFNRRLAPWLIGMIFLVAGAFAWWFLSSIPLMLALASAIAVLSALPGHEDHVNHTLRRQPDLDVLSRLASEADLQRSVFDVTSDLASCVDITKCSKHFSHALRRYWRHHSCSCWLWDKGEWIMLPIAVDQTAEEPLTTKPPVVDAPVTLPDKAHTQLLLDLSPAVSGQAVLVLEQAVAQPIIHHQSERIIRALAEVLRGQLALALRRVILHRDLTQLARHDPLTGVDRRWYGEERLMELLETDNAIVAMLDIDYFKTVNDRFGHIVGDRVLKRVGRSLRSSLRPSDILFRYGGEEFVIAIKGVDIDQGAQTIQRLLDHIASDTNSEPKVTLSAGLTVAHSGDNLKGIIQRADSFCYKAKISGRNQIKYEKET